MRTKQDKGAAGLPSEPNRGARRGKTSVGESSEMKYPALSSVQGRQEVIPANRMETWAQGSKIKHEPKPKREQSTGKT